MKKSLKTLAIGLAIIPCALAMTACGGDDRLVDTSGNYNNTTRSTYSQVEERFAEDSFSTDLSSYRLILDLDVTASAQGQSASLNMNTDIKVKISGTEESPILNASTDISMDMLGEKETVSTYIKNNEMFMQNDWNEWISDGEFLPSQLDTKTLEFSEVFSDISTDDEDLINVWVDENEEEGTCKVKITLPTTLINSFTESITNELTNQGFNGDMEWTDATIYYVFDENGFAGATMDVEMSMDVIYGGLKMEMSCIIKMDFARFNGEIIFPEEI